MGEDITGLKIFRYILYKLITTTIFATCILEVSADHTSEVCPITQLGNALLEAEDGYGLGDLHQMKKMKKEYSEKGYDVTIKRDLNYPSIVAKHDYKVPEVYKLSNGTTAYIVPEGYELKDGMLEQIVAQEILNDSYVTTFEDGTQKALTRP